MQNFAECIAGKGKFCGRKLCKKLRGQASIYSATSQLRHHSGPKINVKQSCSCSEVFKMAEKLACRDFRRTIEHRPMGIQTK